MPVANGVVLLSAGVLLLWAFTWLLAARAAPGTPRAAASITPLLAGMVVGVALVLGSAASPQPVYGAAAGVAAFSTALAIGVRILISGSFSGPAYAIPSLAQRPPGTPGSVSAVGALVAAAAASVTATLAFRVRLLGPSDPALVALAAYLGMLFECWLGGVGKPAGWQHPVRAAAAALLGAVLATALVVLLP